MYKFYESGIKNQNLSLKDKFFNISFAYVLFVILMAAIGVGMLYSAANGNWEPWALKHLMRFGLGFIIMIVLAMVDLRYFMRYAYVFYFATLLMLVYVEAMGFVGMGA
ncbi:MAG: hypothetical protein LBL47_01120, partial [Lactobacillus sp.]|nr:hypothetical protein [Lactobacillus sp.]